MTTGRPGSTPAAWLTAPPRSLYFATRGGDVNPADVTVHATELQAHRFVMREAALYPDAGGLVVLGVRNGETIIEAWHRLREEVGAA